MAKQTINIGSVANDGTGDPLRTAFNKVNRNFNELYADVENINENIPTDVSELSDTSGLLFDGSYDSLTDTPTIPSDVSDLTDTQHIIERRYDITRRNYTLRNINPSTIQPGNFIPQDANEQFSLRIKDTTSLVFHREDNSGSSFTTLFENAKNRKQSFEFYITNNGQSRDVFLTKDVDYISDASNYRGYKASFNNIFNSGRNSISRIVVYNETISPSTAASNTASDDFTVSSLSGASTIAVITLFNSTQDFIGRGQLWNFFTEFVDRVLYTNNEENNIETIKVRFYDNISELKNSIPVLYPNFQFYANTAITANSSIVSGGSGSGASFSLLAGRYEGEPWRDGGLLDGGSGYNVGETLTISGSDLGGTSLNNLSILISGVDIGGTIVDYAITDTSGPAINVWPTNSIENGGGNQYSTTGNIINTNIGSNLNYNQGNRFPVSGLGSTLFGVSSSYNVLYKDSIFVAVAKNANITSLNFSGTFGNNGSIEKSHNSLLGVKGYRVYVESLAIEGVWFDRTGYEVSYSYAGYDVPRFSALTITEDDIIDWNTAYSWGNHNSEDYMKKRRPYAVIENTTGVSDHFVGAYREYLHISPISNWTVNVTGLSLNSLETTDISLTIDQGATPYLPTALRIAGSPQTINWQGGVAPTGTSNGVDVITFSILYTGSNYYVQGWKEGSSNGGGLDISNISGDLIPSTDSTYDLGSATNQWRSLYVSANTIFVGGTPISVDAGGNLLVDGSPVVGGSTGDITFDGVKIQGAGTASGDGNGYSTIELVPDTDLYVYDQYLIVDPTAPNHIHIRAGGTQDDSAAELFLGGEKNYVRVIDGTGIRLYNEERNDTFSSFSDPSDFNTATWYGTPGNYFVQFTEVTAGMGNIAFTFGNDAENRVTVSYGVGETSVLTYGGSTSNLGGGVYRFAVVEAPPSSPTVLTAIEFQIWTTNNNRVELQNNDFTVSVKDDVRITGNDLFSLRNTSPTEPITIRTDYDGANRGWEFAADGTLSTPGDIVVNGDVTGTAGGSTLVLRAEPGSSTAIQLNDSVASEIRTVSNLAIRTDVTNTPRVWTFGTDGGLTFPDATVQNTAFTTSPTLNVLKIDEGVHEKFQSLADATGTVTHDCSSGHIFYHTSPDANWTANFTNLNLASDYATAVTLVIVQGGTGYYPSAVQIGGVAQTLNWQGNTTPTPSTNRTDVVTFSIINNSGTYTVLGQLTGF